MRRRILGSLALLAVCAAPALAQSSTSPTPPPTGPIIVADQPKIGLAVLGGISSSGSSTMMGMMGGTVGGTFTVDLTERVGIETRGTYARRGYGTSAVDLSASLLVNLTGTGGRAVPYVALGGGVHREAFDLGNPGIFGMMGGAYPAGTPAVPIQGTNQFGMMWGSWAPTPGTSTYPWGYGGMMGGTWGAGMMFTSGTLPAGLPTFAAGGMPAFYANRMGAFTVPGDGRWGGRAFTDPALTLGGGVRLGVTERLFVTPDARALVIIGGGQAYTVGVFSFSLGYRF